MKVNRKVIESAAVAVFACAIVVTAVTAGNVNTKAEQYTQKEVTEETEQKVATKEKVVVEVVAAAKDQEELPATEAAPDTATANTDLESTALPEAETPVETPEAAPVVEEAPVVEVSEWATRLMPDVEESLNIRAEGSEESEVLGKLYKGAAADILEQGEAWSKITSGSVEGYVKNEYCVFGQEAEALANELGTVYATSTAGGLRVRAEASTSEEIAIVDVLEEGEKIKVDTQAEVPEGWVAVLCNDTTAYVSAEYVTVELELGKAISIEEELAAIKKAEEEKAAKEAAKRKSSSGQTSSGGTTQRGAVAASYDDVTLLGALIQCEAGGEPYEGQLAVGAVVMNRLRAGYGGSIYDVIYQGGQFAPAMSGSLERRLANGVSGSCLQAAQEAIGGADNVNGALYFKRADSGHEGIVICCHVFY